MAAPWIEAWTLPQTGSFTKVMGPIPYHNLSYDPRFNGVGGGRFSLPYGFARLNEIVNPASNVETLIRVFEDGVNVYSFFARTKEVDVAPIGDIVISGPGIESALEEALVYPFDWAGSDAYPASGTTGVSTFLDTIYGGDNLLANPGWEGGLVNEIQGMSHDHRPTTTLNGAITDVQTSLTLTDGTGFPTSDFRLVIGSERIHVTTRTGTSCTGLTRGYAGTTPAAHSNGAAVEGGGRFRLTYSGQQTVYIDWDGLQSDGSGGIKEALEALTNIVTVDVQGEGTVNQDAWLVEFIDPGEQDNPMMTVDAALLTGGTQFNIVQKQQGGRGRVEPWTKSYNPNTQAEHGGYTTFAVGSTATFGDPAFEGDKALGIEVQVPPPVGDDNYPGYQQIVPVEPGGIYQAKARVYPNVSGMNFAIVVRDLNENLISKQVYSGLTATTWNELSLPNVSIPFGTKQIIFRVAALLPTDGQIWWADGNEFNEGLAPSTAGQIFINLQTTATAESRTILTWLNVSSFSGTLDSDGVAWDKDVSMYIPAGSSWLQVMEDLVRQGYEWKIEWNGSAYALYIYNPGAMGTTVLSKALAPHRMEKAFVRSQSPVHNVLLGEGASNIVDEVTDATLVAAYGRREGYVNNSDLLDGATLLSALNYELEERKAQKTTAKVTVDDTVKFGVDFKLGDIITTDLPNHVARQGLRVRGAMVSVDQAGKTIRTVDVGRYVHRERYGGTTSSVTSEAVNFLLRQRRKIQRLETALADVTNLAPTVAVAESRRPIVVAAWNAPADWQAIAHYVCDGVDDEVQIQAAIDEAAAVATESWVQFSPGNFEIASTSPDTDGTLAYINVPNFVKLVGANSGGNGTGGNTLIRFDGSGGWNQVPYRASGTGMNNQWMNRALFNVKSWTTLENLYITAYSQMDAIRVMGSWCSLRNLWVESDIHCIVVNGGWQHTHIENCGMASAQDDGAYGACLWLNGLSRDCRINDNYFSYGHYGFHGSYWTETIATQLVWKDTDGTETNIPLYGGTGTNESISQSFSTLNTSKGVRMISFEAAPVGTPTDGLTCTIRDANDGTVLLTKTLTNTQLSNVAIKGFVEFYFLSEFTATRTSFTVQIERTGTRDVTNYWNFVSRPDASAAHPYANGTCYVRSSSTWSDQSSDLSFTLFVGKNNAGSQGRNWFSGNQMWGGFYHTTFLLEGISPLYNGSLWFIRDNLMWNGGYNLYGLDVPDADEAGILVMWAPTNGTPPLSEATVGDVEQVSIEGNKLEVAQLSSALKIQRSGGIRIAGNWIEDGGVANAEIIEVGDLMFHDNQLWFPNGSGQDACLSLKDCERGSVLHNQFRPGNGTFKFAYSVRLDANCLDMLVVGNDMRDAYGTAPIIDAGTGTLVDWPADATYGDNFV